MSLTIVMYHYVRDRERTAFPRLHARSLAEFEGQLDQLERGGEPIGMADLRAALAGERQLPSRAFLLTFDDGLTDHRDAVLPALLRRGLTGVFAAIAAPTLERRVVDVQKSQFILAAVTDPAVLLQRVEAQLDAPRAEYRFDDPASARLKELLQAGAPETSRRRLLDELFTELVSDDERGFAETLYLSLADLRSLSAQGMEIAGHGVAHRRLGGLPAAEQRRELEGTLDLLRRIHGREPEGWSMCYPSGSFDETTVSVLAEHGCAVALTVEPGVVEDGADPLRLPRVDTNDLPPA